MTSFIEEVKEEINKLDYAIEHFEGLNIEPKKGVQLQDMLKALIAIDEVVGGWKTDDLGKQSTNHLNLAAMQKVEKILRGGK
jgi:hypothetical protein